MTTFFFFFYLLVWSSQLLFALLFDFFLFGCSSRGFSVFFFFRSSSRIQSEASGLYGRYRVFNRLRFTDIPSAVFAPSSTLSFWFYFLLVFFAGLFPFSSSSADLSLFSFFFFSRPAHISCPSRHKLFWCFFFYLFVYETYTFFFFLFDLGAFEYVYLYLHISWVWISRALFGTSLLLSISFNIFV